LSARAIATTLCGMKKRSGVRKAPDNAQRRSAPSPGIDPRQSVTLSLAIDEWAPPAEVEDRILRKVLHAVDFKGSVKPFE
jgi:hypothetical protein